MVGADDCEPIDLVPVLWDPRARLFEVEMAFDSYGGVDDGGPTTMCTLSVQYGCAL